MAKTYDFTCDNCSLVQPLTLKELYKAARPHCRQCGYTQFTPGEKAKEAILNANRAKVAAGNGGAPVMYLSHTTTPTGSHRRRRVT